MLAVLFLIPFLMIPSMEFPFFTAFLHPISIYMKLEIVPPNECYVLTCTESCLPFCCPIIQFGEIMLELFP